MAVDYKAVAFIPVQSVPGSKPDEPEGILNDINHGTLGQAVLYCNPLGNLGIILG